MFISTQPNLCAVLLGIISNRVLSRFKIPQARRTPLVLSQGGEDKCSFAPLNRYCSIFTAVPLKLHISPWQSQAVLPPPPLIFVVPLVLVLVRLLPFKTKTAGSFACTCQEKTGYQYDDKNLSHRPYDGGRKSPAEMACGSAKPYNFPTKEVLGKRTHTNGKPQLNAPGRISWLSRVECLCATLGAGVVERLVIGGVQNSEERANRCWLRHPLFVDSHVCCENRKSIGRESGATALSKAVAALLEQACEKNMKKNDSKMPPQGAEGTRDDYPGSPICPSSLVEQLCYHPTSREARALSSAMKRVVMEDRGHNQDANEAVWATAAAILHHADLTSAAAQVVRAELKNADPLKENTAKDAKNNSPVAISPALVRVWRSAQRARVWLECKIPASLGKALLVRKVSFLLLLKSWASTKREKGSPKNNGQGDAIIRSMMASELVLQFLLGMAGPASAQSCGGGTGADGVMYGGVDPIIIAAEGDTGALLRIFEVRAARAKARARGFSLAGQLLDGLHSNRSVTEILRAVADGLSIACLRPESAGNEGQHAKASGGVESGFAMQRSSEDNLVSLAQPEGVVGEKLSGAGRLHFMNGVECCGPGPKSELIESVTGFLIQCSGVLRKMCTLEAGATRNHPSRQIILVHALSAVSMDYGKDDHEILQRSQLLPPISKLVDDVDSLAAAGASEALQAFYNCVIPRGDETGGASASQHEIGFGGVGGKVSKSGLDSGEDTLQHKIATKKPSKTASNTPFQAAFLDSVRLKMQEMAVAVWTEASTVNRVVLRLPSTPPATRALLEGSFPLQSERVGMVVPHFPLGTRQSLSLWVLLPAMPMVDMLVLDDDLGGCEVERFPGAREEEAATWYIVVERCVVRLSPILSSAPVGLLDAGEVIEVVPPEARWTQHPLVSGGRRVRIVLPLEGYVSPNTVDGSVLLEPTSPPSRRSASNGDLDGELGKTCALYLSGKRSRGSEEVEARRRRAPGLTPAPSREVSDMREEKEEEARSRSAESRSRRVSRSLSGDSGRKRLHGSLSEGLTGSSRQRPSSNDRILLLKGNEVSLGEDEAQCSWNRMGIEVTSTGALRFFVGEGGSLEASVTSPNGTLFRSKSNVQGRSLNGQVTQGKDGAASGWCHIAVVQDQLDVSLFANGRCCGTGSLPRHLVRPSRPQRRTSIREVESQHPYPNSADKYWMVHIPGATSLTVRFDAKSRTEPEYDFVRIYKDCTRNQVRVALRV